MSYTYLPRHGSTFSTYGPPKVPSNYYLQQKWDYETYKRHRKNIDKAGSVIDNKPPKLHLHVHTKMKKLQMQGDRLAIIERDNKFLLEQIAKIMRSRGKLDNVNFDFKERSMCKSNRQKELLRITNENIAILKRLDAEKSSYSSTKLNEEFMAKQSFMTCISKFDHNWRSTQQPYQLRKEQQAAANKKISQQAPSYVEDLQKKSWAHRDSKSTVPKSVQKNLKKKFPSQ